MAVELSRDLAVFDILLEGDSSNVVQALKEKRPNWSRYGQMIEDAHLLLRTMGSWDIGHVKREVNAAANTLAKEASKSPIEKVWIEETPTCISHIVNLELIVLSL